MIQQYLTEDLAFSEGLAADSANQNVSITEPRGFTDSGRLEFKLGPVLLDLDAQDARSVRSCAAQ
jgi:hypothetical protein